MLETVIYTDGSCLKNPGGAGGYAAIVVMDGVESVVSGGEASSTNNRMEIMAAIAGLESLEQPTAVRIVTDSQYVFNSMSKGWAKSWEKKGWVRQGKPVPNADLWQRLIAQCAIHQVSWNWVRGHDGHDQNERCDRLAIEAARLQ